ncbi:multicopper oxidase domain-containing protein [Isoptericola sp. b515]|uniref:multicopper oxidase domain-containing protein n=1 Tax=Isoptericola sp. b515 TaxID=3064652 RepID=UPI002714288F|nr:multicopper oxidase domain-containing protein [Isoptericola sp. b515]MDO8147485.1 multicopper oxidase domain-containing protein [Isoptericola sp. b515]
MTATRAASTAAPGRGFWPLRDLPVLLWLFAAVVVALVHPWMPAPRWLLVHLVLLGALTHAILVWSRHFTDALLHARPGDRGPQSRRLLLHNLGAITVITGVLTALWPVTVLGATGVAAAVLWHGSDLVRRLRAALPARFTGVVHYYVAAACFLPVGATLGVLLARDLAGAWHTRLLIAHVIVNLLGWVGLTVVGTLVTLWPTMLRTRMAPDAARDARRALPVLIGSVLVAAGAACAGTLLGTAIGIAGYLAGLVIAGRALVAPARRRPPVSFPAMSTVAATTWLVGCLMALTLGIGTASSWAEAGTRFEWSVPFLAAGFGAQLLLGALGYLVPVALGGGPAPVRTANAVLDRAAPLRVAVTNAGLLVCVLPVPSTVRVLASVLVLASLAATLPLLVLAVRASRRAKAQAAADRASGVGPASGATSGPASDPTAPGRARGLAAAGLAAVLLAVTVGVAVDPAALSPGSAQAAGVEPTGEVTTVEIEAQDMRFTPSTVSVPAGNRLVVVVTNTDDDVHDLALDNGAATGRLAPGATERLDVGVVGGDLEGWCTVVGHRQRGMVLHVEVTGGQPAAGADATDDGGGTAGTAAGALDLLAPPPADFRARDAALPPLPPRDGPRVHRETITVRDELHQVAPGVTQQLWTYDGGMPGPVLHGQVGDRFEITLVNDGSIGHSIDFHAGTLAPDEPMRTLAPGESLVYAFDADRAGIWMYHCGTSPASAHIANGMFGAVVVEPRGLPEVDRSYVVVQSELYLGDQDGSVDGDKLAAEQPDAVVFNGYANQYDHRPLPARVGERVRVWVLDAGPNRSTSFHVIGGQFDTVWAEGDYRLDRRDGGDGGAQALALAASQGGFVELVFPEAGSYPFLSHVMVDAERGAHGVFRVTE